MNIRDRKIYYALMTLIGLMGILTSCHREEIPNDPQQSETPISFTPNSDWPTLTKSTIFDETGYLYGEPDDLAGDGIVVWGSVDGTYVFGENGTTAEHTPNGNSIVWDYWTTSEQKYWRPGTYTFASVLPASAFATVNPINTTDTYTATWSNDYTTLSFNPAFNLSTDQIDLMIAHASKEYTSAHMNGTEEIGSVNLSFSHTLALLNITLTNGLGSESTITVNSIKLYGNHASASAYDSYDLEWTFAQEAGSDNPYFTKEFTECNTSDTTPVSLMENLLVFPESTTLTIEVCYKENWKGVASKPITRKAEVPVEWSAGNQYTYPLKVTQSGVVLMGEPSVSPWPNDVTQAGNDIEIKN